MARCGTCGSNSCACVIQAGTGITVTGAGTLANPYIVTATGGGGAGSIVTVGDTPTIDLSISGDGSVGTPYVITGALVTEGVQDLVGAMVGNGLVYNDGANQILAKLSTDPGNTLSFGGDGGLFGTAADTAVYMTLGTAQNVTAKKTWNLPNDTTGAIRINTVSGVNPTTSDDSFAVYWAGTTRSGWFNEWGGLRVFTINPATLGYSDQAVKLFTRQAVTAVQLIRANTSSVIWSLTDIDTSHCQQVGGYGALDDLDSFTNGFVAYSSTTYYTPQIWTAVGGHRAEMRGQVLTDNTPASGQTIATIPTAFRPARTVQLHTAANDGTLVRLEITPAGALICRTSGTYSDFSLDGLSYYLGAN